MHYRALFRGAVGTIEEVHAVGKSPTLLFVVQLVGSSKYEGENCDSAAYCVG